MSQIDPGDEPLLVPQDRSGYFAWSFNTTQDLAGDFILPLMKIPSLCEVKSPLCAQADKWQVSVYLWSNWDGSLALGTFATMSIGPDANKLLSVKVKNSAGRFSLFKCHPGNACGSDGDSSGTSQPYECMSNYPILPEQLAPDGALFVQMTVQGLDQVMCDANVPEDLAISARTRRTYPVSLLGMLVFRSKYSMPTFTPTAKPTQGPTKGLPNASALAAQAPLPVSLTLTAAFILLAFTLVQMTKRHKRVHQPPLISTCITSGFLGFALVSEIFLVIMMLSFPKYSLLASLIIGFRALHPVTFAFMARRVFVTEAAKYEQLLDLRYIFENSKVYGVVAATSILDVSALYLLPWFDSEMTRKCSYPNAFFFTRCLAVKFAQSSATICCQILFIVGINSGNLGQISLLSLIFLGFNIFCTICLALLNMVDLFVKTSIVNNGVLKTAAEMPPKDDVETDLELLFGRRMNGEEIAAFRNALTAIYSPGVNQPRSTPEVTKSPLVMRGSLAEAMPRASHGRPTHTDGPRLSHGHLYEPKEAVPYFENERGLQLGRKNNGAVLSLALATTQPQTYGNGSRRDSIPALRASVIPAQSHHHRFPPPRLNPGATHSGLIELQNLSPMHAMSNTHIGPQPPIPPTPPSSSLRRSRGISQTNVESMSL